jgi:NAD-dependent SIR2 family protein deacetylase
LQFIDGGPHIPDDLIERLEDGDLAIFAGAGVSKNIGLPLFGELVDQVYEHLSQKMQPEEQQEFANQNYDRVLGLLEATFEGNEKVRDAVRTLLAVTADQPLPLHKALLQLARTPDASYRLVTTNFDRAFVMAAGPSVTFEAAPALPVPARADGGIRCISMD